MCRRMVCTVFMVSKRDRYLALLGMQLAADSGERTSRPERLLWQVTSCARPYKTRTSVSCAIAIWSGNCAAQKSGAEQGISGSVRSQGTLWSETRHVQSTLPSHKPAVTVYRCSDRGSRNTDVAIGSERFSVGADEDRETN